jgi:polysaccharide biosynthesis transport protein
MSLADLIKRSWFIFVVAALAGGVASYFGAKRITPKYQAELSLLTGPIGANLDAQRAYGNLARTYADLATSGPILRRTLRASHASLTVDAFRSDVSATSNDVTRIVTVRVENANPDLAARLANALGQQLIAVSARGGGNAVSDFMADSAVTSLSPVQQGRVRAAAVSAFGLLASGRLNVVDPAEPPTSAVSPKVPLLTALGVLVGLLIAAIVAFIRESFGGRRGIGRRETPGGLPVLASVASSETTGGVTNPEYEVLAARIGAGANGRRIRTVLTVNADRGSGSGAVAANLAAALASQSSRVTLIDANTDESEITTELGLTGHPGYTELLRSGVSQSVDVGHYRAKADRDLTVIPRGIAGDPESLTDVERGKQVLRTVSPNWNELVVIDAPSVDEQSSALVWARIADATVLVTRNGRAGRQAVERAQKALAAVGANLVGTVVRE